MKTKITTFIKNPMASGSILMIAGSMSVNVINYVYHLIMGRVLGPELYGILASIYSVLYIVSIIPQSSSVTIVKFISKAKDDEERAHVYKGINNLVNKVALWGAIFLVLLSPFLKIFLNLNNIWPILFVVPIYYFSILLVSNQAILQGVLSFLGVVVTNFTTSIIKLILGLVFIYLGFGASGAVFAIVVGIFLAFYFSKKYLRKFIKETKKETTFDIGSFTKYAGPVILQALAFTSLFTIDLVLVKHFFPDFDAGLYAAVSTLGKIIFFAAAPITAVMFPLVSGKKSKGESIHKIFMLSFLITLALSLSIVLFYFAVPKFTIGILYGQKYLSAANILPWMGLFISIYTLSQLLVNFFLSIDIVDVVKYPFIASVLQIILIWFFHNSLFEVIQISLVLVTVLLGILLIKLKFVYNHIKINA